MSRTAWAAIFAAIAFPTIALVVVLFFRPASPPGAFPPPPWNEKGPPPPHKGPPPVHKGPPLRDEMLVSLRERLELSEEQVEEIWKIGQPARRRMAELEISIVAKERELRSRLDADDVEEEDVLATFEELHRLHFDREKLRLLTPLRLRQVLTAEQRSKLVEVWREGPPGGFGKGPGKGRGGPFGHGHGKGPGKGYPGPGGGWDPHPGHGGPPPPPPPHKGFGPGSGKGPPPPPAPRPPTPHFHDSLEQ